MLSDELRATLESFVKSNEAKIAECEKARFKEGSIVAALVEHLKRQNSVFRKVLG